MKKSIITVGAMLASAVCVLAQGTLSYNQRVANTVIAPTYLGAPGEPAKSGNTQAGFPAESQTYLGPLLAGSGFSAQLFFAVGLNQPESALIPLASSLTTFRTSATFAGTLAPSFQSLPGVAVGGAATLQLRAWDNAGGTLLSYDLAAAAGRAAGKSVVFNIEGLVDATNPAPPTMNGLRSFNITIVPEPSTFVLAGLGAAALVIFRRRK
jgi:hypothetical protein